MWMTVWTTNILYFQWKQMITCWSQCGSVPPDGVPVEGSTSVQHWGQTSHRSDQRGWGRESGGCTWGCQTCRFGGPPIPEAQPALAPPEHHPTDDEVVVKKRALKHVSNSRCRPFFMERTCQRELRPGKLPRSHTRFRLSPEERWPVLCADKSSRCTTKWPFIWASIGVRNSHVVSVGRF